MQKSDLISMIMDNILVYNISLPSDLKNTLQSHLEQFDEKILGNVAGFNKKFLEHFLILSKGKTPKEIEEDLEKMAKISLFIGPTGTLSYLTEEQVEYILTKLGSLKLKEIKEDKISILADEILEQQFGSGGGNYGGSQALENQLASASFYLLSVGFSQQDVQKKINEARQDPNKIDELFNLKPPQAPRLTRESRPTGGIDASSVGQGISSQESDSTSHEIPDLEEIIKQYIEQLKGGIDHPPERAQKISELIEEIKKEAKEKFSRLHEEVFRLMHPDRLNRVIKVFKKVKRKSNKMDLMIEWFFCSELLQSIEFKVEHWQVSSAAGHGQAGVYSAGISFSRYDQIVADFDDKKLEKVINIAQKLLQQPSKKGIQKLGQDLVAETGFDEHLYFTD